MKSTMQYSVGGQIFDVADDRRDEFFADAANDFDEAPEEVITFWVNGSPVQVKASRVDEFMADCEADGVTPKRTRNFRMDDGEMLRLDDEDVRQFVNARRTGQAMSRGLLKQTGIPEHYGRSASDREALADVMAAYYPEDTVDPQYLDRGRNLGDAVSEGAGAVGRAANEVMLAPGSASREWMDRGAENGEYLPTAVKNVNAYAGKVASGIANLLPAATDVVGQVLGGESTAAGRYMRQSANAGRQAIADNIDTVLPEYETGSEIGNAVLNKANEFVGDTGATLVKFAIPGAAAVDISANAANTYYDAYQKAMANGADDRKAEALAAAAAGVGAVEGIILAQSANGSGGANGFIKRVLEVAGKMGGAATARDVVQQGVEGADGPDVGRAVAEGAKGAAEGAAFETMSGAVHGARNRLAGRTGDHGEARFREEQARNDSREAKRDVARDAHDRSISEETAWQLDREIQEQVDAGTISEQAKDRVKARVMGLYDSARSLDDPKLREGALMKAVTEENTRRETPARVTSDAHERRLVEERMRENEYWARRGDELVAEFGKEEAARKLADEQAKSDMRKADELADSNARQQRERELQSAFGREPSMRGQEERSKRKAEMAEYEKQESERKSRESEEEGTLQPQEVRISVDGRKDGALPESENTEREWGEYKSWLSKNGRSNTAKNWNKFIMETERDPNLKVDTKDQLAWEERLREHEGDTARKETRKPYDYGEAAGDSEERRWDEARATRERVRRQHPEMSDDDFNARWNSFDHGYRKAVSEWEARKEQARKQGKKFIEPMPEASQMEFEFNTSNPVDTTPKTETPAMTSRDAAVILGVDAYDKAELTRKLSQWEASPTDANAKHRAAAKVMLARLEGPQKKPVVETQEPAVATRKPDGKGRIASVRPVENESVSRTGTDEPTQKLPATPTTTPTTPTKSTDGGFAAWSKGIEFANDAERRQSRDLFDSLVKRGKVNGETGQRIEPGETTETVTPPEPVPTEKTSSAAKTKQPTALAAANAEAKTAAAMRLAKMETADLQDQRGALLAAKESGDTSKRTANQIASIEQELVRRNAPLEQRSEGDVYMRNLDPNLRSDAKVVDWARKQGRAVPTDARSGKPTVDIETMREYNRNRAMNAAKIVKRAFPGMEVTYHDKPDGVERGQHDIELRDRHGRSLGRFSPSKNKVALLPGSDAETVAHEIGWHAARHWATTEANGGNVKARKMLDAMHDVENNVPSALRSKVLHLYRSARGYTRDDILNEFGAWDFMTLGGKDLERALESREAQRWYGKAVTTMKDMWKDFASAHGMNRVELEKIDGMSIEQFKNFISKQLVEGKTFGELKTPGNNPIDLDETLKGKYLRKVYDVNAPLQEIVRRVEKKTGHKIASDDSIADENARKVGYQEAAHIAFKNRLSGFRDILRETGLSQEQVGYYMACKAAEGRDAKIDRRNMDALVEKSRKLAANEIHDTEIRNGTGLSSAQKKAIYDRYATESVRNYVSTNGSGIRPEEARKTIDELERGSMGAEYKRAARYLREVVNETLKEQRDQGLVGADEYAKWTSEEPEYVPFKSTIDSATGEYVGRSMDLGGFEHKTAKGRKTAADDIVGHIFEDFQATKMRAVENGVRQKLAKLVRDNPEIGTVEKAGGQSISERKLGDSVKTSDGGRDNVVLFKEDGVPMVITLNGELGKQAAAAITGRNRSHMPEWFRKTTRAFASMATEHSPTFSVRNFQKDQLALAEIVLAERGAKDGARFMGHYASAQKDIHGALWKFVATGDVDASTKGGRILQDYIDAGGMIGGYEKETLGEMSKALSYDEIRKSLKSGKNFAKAVGRHTVNSVAYLNKISELTSRVGTFEAERRMGTDKDGNAVTDKSAALYSRRALVDFNQGGENTGVTNALKMFSNSGIGANMRAVQAMMGNRHGAGLMAAMITWGASQAVINHVMNPDDDKREREGLSTNKDIGEHELRTGFAFFRRGDKAFKIGQHEDVFTLASYFGNTLARCALGDISKEQAAKNLGISVAELATVFSGLGDANLDSRDGDAAGVAKAVALYLTPSIAQPVGEIALNQDYAGRELYVPKNRSESTPSYQKARNSTPEYAVTASEWLNRKSGGNSARSGKIDIPPEVVQKLVEGYGKNALKDVMNIYETGKAIMNGEYGKLEPNLKPFARDFVKKVPDSTNRYYTRKAEVADDFDEWRKLKDGMTADERRNYLEEHPWVREKDKINNIEDRIQTLSKKEQGMVKKGRSWVEMEREPTDGQIDNWKRMRLRLQAKMLERTKKR